MAKSSRKGDFEEGPGAGASSEQADEASLSARVAVDVSFSRLDRRMSGENLDVAQAAPGLVNVARGPRDEGAPARV
jgi:hypothetical protein